MTLAERIRQAESRQLADRLAAIDTLHRLAKVPPIGHSYSSCGCCPAADRLAAASRAARRQFWKSPAARDISSAAAWLTKPAQWAAAILGSLALMLICSINF